VIRSIMSGASPAFTMLTLVGRSDIKPSRRANGPRSETCLTASASGPAIRGSGGPDGPVSAELIGKLPPMAPSVMSAPYGNDYMP
jgi:hypothetical protein